MILISFNIGRRSHGILAISRLHRRVGPDGRPAAARPPPIRGAPPADRFRPRRRLRLRRDSLIGGFILITDFGCISYYIPASIARTDFRLHAAFAERVGLPFRHAGGREKFRRPAMLRPLRCMPGPASSSSNVRTTRTTTICLGPSPPTRYMLPTAELPIFPPRPPPTTTTTTTASRSDRSAMKTREARRATSTDSPQRETRRCRDAISASAVMEHVPARRSAVRSTGITVTRTSARRVEMNSASTFAPRRRSPSAAAPSNAQVGQSSTGVESIETGNGRPWAVTSVS